MHAKTMPDMLTITRPDDWHLHLRDGAPMRSVVGATARVFGRAVRHAESRSAGHHGCRRSRLSRRSRRGAAFGVAFRAADDPVSHRQHDARSKSSAPRCGFHHRRQILSGRRDDQFGIRRHRARATSIGARRNGGVRAAAARAWRSHRPGRRHVRSRTSLRRASAGAHRARFPRLEARLRAHHDARSRRSSSPPRRRTSARRSRRITCCGRAMRCSPGGIRPHSLLPADTEARSASRGRWSTRRPSGNPKFFLGTDSAPHARHAKESACGCAGCYSAPLAIELYAEVFDAAGALDKLEGFASFHGADFYGLPRNAGTITLERATLDGAGELPVRRRARSCRSCAGETLALARRLTRCVRSVITEHRSRPDRRCPLGRKPEVGRGKSGLRRAGCWVTPRRYKSFARAAMKARNRATETSRPGSGQTVRERVKRGNLHPEQHQVSGRRRCSPSPRVGGSSAAVTRRLDE